MLSLVAELVRRLDESEVRFCHWKSNARLSTSIAGRADLDLLVAPESRAEFDWIATALGFIEATERGVAAEPRRHHFGYDEASGVLVHLDVIEAVVTGGTLAKAYRLAVDEQIWASLERLEGMPVPARPVELALLSVRKMLEAGALTELPLMRREAAAIREEVEWLTREPGTIEQAQAWLRDALPEAPAGLLPRAVEALLDGSWREQWWLGRQFAKALRRHRRMNGVTLGRRRTGRLVGLLRRRLGLPHAGLTVRDRAPLIAFVGAKAVGKSTLLEETRSWLSPHFSVVAVHAGRPPAAWWSRPLNGLLPLGRRLFGGYRHSLGDARERREMAARRSWGSAAFTVRAVLLAADKRRLLERTTRWRERGSIVLCDRYPLAGIDGPLLDASDLEARGRRLKAALARREREVLAGVPRPDLVISLQTSIEIALERHERRRRTGEPHEAVSAIRRRHAEASEAEVKGLRVVTIDTSGALAETSVTVRRAVWDLLLDLDRRRADRARGRA